MSSDGLGGEQQVFLPNDNVHVRSARWQLVLVVTLVAVALTAGVSIAAGDLDWDGTEPRDLSDSAPNRAWHSAIAADPSGRIVVAWSDQELYGDVARDIYVRRSDDSGSTWFAPEVISATALVSALPDACVKEGRAFVAWVDQSSIGGLNVALYEAEVGAGSARRIPSPVSLTSTRPRLAASSTRLHVVFNAGANILHASRPLTATAWPTATPAYTSTALLLPWFPMVAAGSDGQTLHVVWQERTLEGWTIMYGHGTVNGDTVDWQPPLQLYTGSVEAFYPAIAADSEGSLHVVWGEAVGTGPLDQRKQNVRYTRYDVSSGEWISPAVSIDPNPVYVNRDNPTYTAPSMAVWERGNRAEICVAWHGFRAGAFGEDVLLSCSSDRGRSWSVPWNVSGSSDVEGISIAPAIAFDRWGRLHGVWQEHRADMGNDIIYDYQVYYSHALTKVFLIFVARYG